MPDPFKDSPLALHPLTSRDYDPERGRERIRGAVALTAMLIFALVIGFYIVFSATAPKDAWDHMKEAMQAVLPAVTSVLGTVLGFYFGSQKR